MPAASPDVTTIAELLALPEDGLRHELLDGVHVVTPAPALLHQAMVRELMALLIPALQGQDRFHLFSSPADVILGVRTLVQPDVFVVVRQPGKPLRCWEDVGVPVLAVEILSPATATRDRGAKRHIYNQAGVGEYWIVDLDARLFERWRPRDSRPEIIDERLVWKVGEVPELLIDVTALFARVLDS
ncbi:MAG TPA: Uma2 family endonuclease [Gemmatimonadales bacterium]|nr:Uma2 family endonuclease [Gemmatimonadales bacterium]